MKSLTLKLLKRSGLRAASFKAILSILFAVVLLLVSSCSDPSNPANTGTGDNTSQNGDNPSSDNPSGGTDNPSTDNPSTDNPSGNGTKNNPKIVEIQASQLAAAIQNYTAGTYTIYKVSGQMTDADYNSNITLINETLRNKWDWERYVGLDLSKVTGLTKVKMITNLSSLTIPDTVTNVGFDRLFGLQVLPDNPNFTMEDGVLYSKDKTVLYYYSKDKKGKSFEIPSGVKCIRNFAFEETALEEITIPESVIDIGMRAFYDQTLIFKNKENWISDITGKILTAEELENPDSWIYFDMQTNVSGPCRNGIYKPVTKTVALENIEEEINSFKPNSHTIFKLSGQVTNEQYSQICRLIRNKCDNEGWAWDQKGYIGLDLTETNGLTTLSGSWDGIFTLAIPDSVTEIPYVSPYTIEKIANFSNHPNFIFEDGVLYSKDKKTLYCYSLNKEDENFEIPSGVELIWEDAFNGNNKIKNITIPASVRIIFDAFDNSSIQSLVFEDKEGWFFCDNDGKKVVSVNAEDLENVENYRWNSQSQKRGIFQNGLIKIATKEISASQLKGEIEAYNSNVFTCYKVTGEMTNEQFSQIEELVEQKYNDGDWIDIQIGLDLSAVTGLTVIWNYSFFRLVIPESFVPNAASSFLNVTIPDSNKNFVYEDGVLYSADKSILCRFAEDNTKESFVIPSTVKIICDDAFYNIPNIKNITIPQSVTYIGAHAFEKSSIQTLSFADKEDWMAKVNYRDMIEVSARELENIANYIWDRQTQQAGICRNGLFKFEIKTVTAGQLKSEIEAKTSTSYSFYTVSGEMTNDQFREISQLVRKKFEDEWNREKYIGLDLSAVTGLTSISGSGYFCKIIIPKDFVPDETFSLAYLPIPSENPNFVYEDGVLYSADKTILYRFDESGEKESFVIPSTVTKIWREAFWDIRNLKSITIPQSVTYIGNGAFANGSLETLNFASKENWKTVDGDANVSAGDLENKYNYGRYDGVPDSGKFLPGIYKSE